MCALPFEKDKVRLQIRSSTTFYHLVHLLADAMADGQYAQIVLHCLPSVYTTLPTLLRTWSSRSIMLLASKSGYDLSRKGCSNTMTYFKVTYRHVRNYQWIATVKPLQSHLFNLSTTAQMDLGSNGSKELRLGTSASRRPSPLHGT